MKAQDFEHAVMAMVSPRLEKQKLKGKGWCELEAFNHKWLLERDFVTQNLFFEMACSRKLCRHQHELAAKAIALE